MHTYNRRVLVILHQCNKWSVLCASSVISPADLRPNPLQHAKAPCAEPEFSSATFLQFSAKVRLCYTIINCLRENFTLKHLTFPMFYWASHKNKMLAASDRWTRFWIARERHGTAMARCTSQVWFVHDWYFRNGPKMWSEYRNIYQLALWANCGVPDPAFDLMVSVTSVVPGSDKTSIDVGLYLTLTFTISNAYIDLYV